MASTVGLLRTAVDLCEDLTDDLGRGMRLQLVAAFGLWLLGRDPRRALKFGLAAAVGLLPWMLFYLLAYGTPLGPAQSQMAAGGWRTDLLEPLAGVLFSPGRGLFVYQPWVALAL